MNKFDSLKNFLISIPIESRVKVRFSVVGIIFLFMMLSVFFFTIIHLIEINSQEQNLAILFTPNQYHQLHKKLRIRETYAISA